MAPTKTQPALPLTQEQQDTFYNQGFLTVDSLVPAEEVSFLRGIFQDLFARRAGRDEGAQYDMVGHDDDDGPQKLSQILRPINFAPELERIRYRANGLAVARQLLGPTAVEVSDHAILKPAGYGAPTPWHQDEAFRDSGFTYEQLSIWMPLQEATLENGCMQYVPGSHRREVLDHRSPHDDPRVHALECAGEFDAGTAVACPLSAGGAVIHHGRTLHYAGANRSDIPRYAYILMYETPPVPTAEAREYRWNQEKQTARMARRASWRRRGGLLVTLQRKLRTGFWRSPRLIAFEFQRMLQAIGRRFVSR